jgi:hypothetical protein
MDQAIIIILRAIGGIILFIAFVSLVLIGKAHSERNDASLFNPTFSPMDPDLMEKMDKVLKLGLLGGVLFILSYVIEYWLQ